jgi:hypothetical protein
MSHFDILSFWPRYHDIKLQVLVTVFMSIAYTICQVFQLINFITRRRIMDLE